MVGYVARQRLPVENTSGIAHEDVGLVAVRQ
jgi:hypothetical protein